MAYNKDTSVKLSIILDKRTYDSMALDAKISHRSKSAQAAYILSKHYDRRENDEKMDREEI